MSKDPFQERESLKYKNPIQSREFILSLLEKFKKPVSRDEIAEKLNLLYGEKLDSLTRRLRAMEKDGQLVCTKRKHYILPKRLNLLQGKVSAHRDGYGFLCVNGGKNDFYLSAKQMKNCLHRDIILAYSVNLNYKGRYEARIIKILKPYNGPIVGRYIINDGNAFVIPDDSRFNFKILIPDTKDCNIYVGLMVVVEIIQRATRTTQALGKIIEVLDTKFSTDLSVDVALRAHEIPYVWPKEVEKEISKLMKSISSKDITKDRIDIRHLPMVTIDSEDSHDFDDALYCEKKDDGWRLWVAIADVSYYVRPGSALDNEARRRGTSVYFPSKVIPMLPEILSNHLCSLNMKKDRLCMVCEMNISSEGKLTSYKHYEAVMNSHACLTYNQVWKILQGNPEYCHRYKWTLDHLKELNNLYQILNIAREKRGGISVETEEIKFIFNSDSRIKCIERIEHNDAHRLIEECMILTNIASACFVEKNKEPMLFRVHERPSKDSIISFQTILKKRGLILLTGESLNSLDYANFLKKIADRQDAEMLQTMILRSMKQAIYTPKNCGHFGLALSSYTHFTSPIRRYPDLLLHRTIKYLLTKNEKKIKNNKFIGACHYNMKQMIQFGQHCSMTERRADEATRDVADWLKCDFMQDQIGNVYQGIISNVTNFGFFVRINKLLVDGLVHVSTLDDDYYRFDSIHQQLVGETTGCIYQIGDLVKVRVNAVNISEHKIDFFLISRKIITAY